MNFLKYKKLFLIISGGVLLPGFVALYLWGLQLSIDFTGGSLLSYQFGVPVQTEDLRTVLQENGVDVQAISKNSETDFTIRAKEITPENIDPVKTALAERFEGATLKSFETVGPTIGKETTRKALVSLFWASLAILLYIAYVFRNIPKPHSSFRFGMSAIFAMLHDVFVVLGVFAFLGHFWNVEVDALFITAMLTVIGFSVHDTIVVFDRIRENLNKLPKHLSFEYVTNYSLVETLNRSLATSFTVVLTLLSLFLLGGASIRVFVLAMLIGIISGTYSSIFMASPILVMWEEYSMKKNSKNK